MRNDKKEAGNIDDSPIIHGTVPLTAIPLLSVHLHSGYILVGMVIWRQRELLLASSESLRKTDGQLNNYVESMY